MADDIQEQAFYIEKHEVVVDSDEEFTYEEVPVDDDFASVVEEDLDTALRVINEARGDAEAAQVQQTQFKKPNHLTFLTLFIIFLGFAS